MKIFSFLCHACLGLVCCLGAVNPSMALDSPAQDNSINLIDLPYGGWIENHTLNGERYEAGFTFSGWFYFSQLPPERRGLLGYNWESIFLENQGDGSINFWLMQDGLTFVPTLDSWTNIAVSFNGHQATFYLDGNPVATRDYTQSVLQFPNGEGEFFQIGGAWFQVKQLKMWDRPLSDVELVSEVQVVDSSISGPTHQWIGNEGRGPSLFDSGVANVANFENRTGTPFWVSAKSPYRLLLSTYSRIYGDLPLIHAWGAADFNQDQRQEVFFHGGNDYDTPSPTPLRVLSVPANGAIEDSSEHLIEGGLYNKLYPSGRTTVVADLNGDRFDDVFYTDWSGHGQVRSPTLPALLLSDANLGKLSPAEQSIKSAPCTLTEPAFDGQKPCSSNNQFQADLRYPDESAPLVNLDSRIAGHAATFGDIDLDGDIDLFVQAHGFNFRADYPVLPHFLINDGSGNFVANWQLVPHKVLNYYYDFFQYEGVEQWQTSDVEYNFANLSDLDGDGFLDLVVFAGTITENVLRNPPANPFAVESEDAWTSRYDLVAWGSENGFSEDYSILYPGVLPVPDAHQVHAYPLSIDIENDGDLDIIVSRESFEEATHSATYLQLFLNEGGRVFVDRTDEFLPQSVADILQQAPNREIHPMDFNGDGCADFYAGQAPQFGTDSARAENPHRLWLNNCAGFFTPVRDSFIGKMGLLIPFDYDGDGDTDFVSVSRNIDATGEFLSAAVVRKVGELNLDQFIDTDRDGDLDASDTDDDGDSVPDNLDAFPKDRYEQLDTDGDGVGDNSDPLPNDFDNDGADDNVDAFPKDPTETTDSDGDGLGDNKEMSLGTNPNNPDSDGDGHSDKDELEAGTDPLSADDFPASTGLPIGIIKAVIDGRSGN